MAMRMDNTRRHHLIMMAYNSGYSKKKGTGILVYVSFLGLFVLKLSRVTSFGIELQYNNRSFVRNEKLSRKIHIV